MKLLALWAPLADYTVACLKHLTITYNIELLLVYRPVEPDAPYSKFDLSFCKAVSYDNQTVKNITATCLDFAPDVVLMSSWNYRAYREIAGRCRKKSSFVVSTFDGQWKGTLRQRLGIIMSPFFLKPVIDNFFVPGDRQATFARKLGYKNPYQGYYSANTTNLAQAVPVERVDRFVFVGRLIDEKGINILIEAYRNYRATVESPWELYICGTGPLQPLCQATEGIRLLGFVQPEDLSGILAACKCLVLPSFREPWGLVIHEAALAGLCIISSHSAGASTFFLRDGENGYIINPDKASVELALKLISQLTVAQIANMSSTSKTLGRLWTTEKWADYVYENICLRKHLINHTH